MPNIINGMTAENFIKDVNTYSIDSRGGYRAATKGEIDDPNIETFKALIDGKDVECVRDEDEAIKIPVLTTTPCNFGGEGRKEIDIDSLWVLIDDDQTEDKGYRIYQRAAIKDNLVLPAASLFQTRNYRVVFDKPGTWSFKIPYWAHSCEGYVIPGGCAGRIYPIREKSSPSGSNRYLSSCCVSTYKGSHIGTEKAPQKVHNAYYFQGIVDHNKNNTVVVGCGQQCKWDGIETSPYITSTNETTHIRTQNPSSVSGIYFMTKNVITSSEDFIDGTEKPWEKQSYQNTITFTNLCVLWGESFSGQGSEASSLQSSSEYGVDGPDIIIPNHCGSTGPWYQHSLMEVSVSGQASEDAKTQYDNWKKTLPLDISGNDGAVILYF